jgi:hypothetical protein
VSGNVACANVVLNSSFLREDILRGKDVPGSQLAVAAPHSQDVPSSTEQTVVLAAAPFASSDRRPLVTALRL